MYRLIILDVFAKKYIISSHIIYIFKLHLIVQVFFISGEGCKSKWQNLRDNFRKEHAKFSKTPTGSAALGNTISSWKYYKQLLFLVDVFSSRKMQTNIPPVSSQLSEFADADISSQAVEYHISTLILLKHKNQETLWMPLKQIRVPVRSHSKNLS